MELTFFGSGHAFQYIRHLTPHLAGPRVRLGVGPSLIDQKPASWLKMYPDIARSGLIAEGWADSVGSDEACLKVSLERARTAAEYIASSLGVKVTPVGKGKSFDPPNNSEENKQRNRRVVIKRATPAVSQKP